MDVSEFSDALGFRGSVFHRERLERHKVLIFYLTDSTNKLVPIGFQFRPIQTKGLKVVLVPGMGSGMRSFGGMHPGPRGWSLQAPVASVILNIVFSSLGSEPSQSNSVALVEVRTVRPTRSGPDVQASASGGSSTNDSIVAFW